MLLNKKKRLEKEKMFCEAIKQIKDRPLTNEEKLVVSKIKEKNELVQTKKGFLGATIIGSAVLATIGTLTATGVLSVEPGFTATVFSFGISAISGKFTNKISQVISEKENDLFINETESENVLNLINQKELTAE